MAQKHPVSHDIIHAAWRPVIHFYECATGEKTDNINQANYDIVYNVQLANNRRQNVSAWHNNGSCAVELHKLVKNGSTLCGIIFVIAKLQLQQLLILCLLYTSDAADE